MKPIEIGGKYRNTSVKVKSFLIFQEKLRKILIIKRVPYCGLDDGAGYTS